MPTWAQEPVPSIEQLEQQLAEQKEALDRTSRSLEQLKLQAQVPEGDGAATGARERDADAAAQAPSKQRVEQQDAQAGRVEPVGQAPASPQRDAAEKVASVMEQPGILTPRGTLVAEPSLQFNYSNNNQISLLGFSVLPAILVGLIDVRQVDTSTLMGAASFRYGLSNRLELNAKIPYVYGRQNTTMRPVGTGSSGDEVFSNSGQGIGDVQIGARYQLNQGGGSTPYYIGSFQATLPTGKGPFDVPYSSNSVGPGGMPLQQRQPTGSGFSAFDVGLLGIYPSDPAVFFGGLNYTWVPGKNIDKTIGGVRIGHVKPGNSVKLSFGMGLSLNDKASFSVGYQHAFIGSTKYRRNKAMNSPSVQAGQLLIGYGYQVSPRTNLNLTLGVGVTRYAPNAELLLRIPMSF